MFREQENGGKLPVPGAVPPSGGDGGGGVCVCNSTPAPDRGFYKV